MSNAKIKVENALTGLCVPAAAVGEIRREAVERASMEQIPYAPGVGATEEYNLRVSAATLARVRLRMPDNKPTFWVFEAKVWAEVKDGKIVQQVAQLQPLGGACQLIEPETLWQLTKGFNFDSDKSRRESDFRLFVRAGQWDLIKEFLEKEFARPADGAVASDIKRELVEEIEEALRYQLRGEFGYLAWPMGTVVQGEAQKTLRSGMVGVETKRVFKIYDVEILDARLVDMLLTGARPLAKQMLDVACEKALASPDGKGRVTSLALMRDVDMRDHQTFHDPNALRGFRAAETIDILFPSR
jgi:hypothetical protein